MHPQWPKNSLLVVGYMNILYVLNTVTAVGIQRITQFQFFTYGGHHIQWTNLSNTVEQ